MDNCACISLLAPRVRTRLPHTAAALERRLGALLVSEATTIEEARSFFSELKARHIKRWGDQPSGDAFDRSFFERFHHELIARCLTPGLLRLARVKADPVTLGLLDNCVFQSRVSFYQSGINYAAAERGKSTGLVVHALVIYRNAKQGQATYDMLAGDAQYKRALAGLTMPLWRGELQANRLKLRAEDLLTSGDLTLHSNGRSVFR
jgi:CelD/BcsL family acetyltransferase involved in cellulose biosynthesis